MTDCVLVPLRRIERNAARTPEVLPPDVDTKVIALSRLDSPELQTRAVTTMLNHARTGLLAAIAAQDLPQIVAFKQKAAAIQEIAKQVRLGKDMQLDSAEFVRRAERGLGLAIREGQANGTVETTAEARSRSAQIARGSKSSEDFDKPKISDFLTKTESTGGRSSDESVFAMTDGVSDEAFEAAVAESRAEAEASNHSGTSKLSRANVARKAKAQADVASGRDLDDPRHDDNVVAEPSAAQPKKRLTKHDSTEMLANINGMLNGIVESIPFINPAEVDFSDKDSRRVIENIRESMARVRKLLKEIENG